MRKLPPLPAVKVFEAAARHENFSRAAAELGMTQAAVSYQIKLLEERLGVALFVRSKGRVLLSEAGTKAAPLVSSGLRDIAAAFAGISGEGSNVLTISTSQAFASNWLAPRLSSFQATRPGLTVRLVSLPDLGLSAPEGMDVAIDAYVRPPESHGCKAEFLFRLHSAPISTPEFRERHAIREPADLLRAPRLNPDAVWWADWFSLHGIDQPPGGEGEGMRLDTQALEGNAALAGLGVGMLTPLFWRPEIAGGRLVQLFPRIVCEAPSYWLFYSRLRGDQRAIGGFRDWLLARIEEEAALGPEEVFRGPEDQPRTSFATASSRPLTKPASRLS